MPTSSSLDSDNCVTCSGTPDCPACDNDEQCAMTTRTCSECPRTYCTRLTTTLTPSPHHGLSSAQVGGIAIGTVAGAAIILCTIGYFLYKKWWLVKHPRRASVYAGEVGDLEKQKRMSSATFATSAGKSMMSRASNILNVAYIPGVKISSAKQTSSASSARASVMSRDTYMSGLDTASFHSGQIASKGSAPQLVSMAGEGEGSSRSGGSGLRNQIIEEEEEEDSDDDLLDMKRASKVDSSAGATWGTNKVSVVGNGTAVSGTTTGTTATTTTTTTDSAITPLSLKHNPEPLDSDSDSDSSDSDSDEENIEKINAKIKGASAGSSIVSPRNAHFTKEAASGIDTPDSGSVSGAGQVRRKPSVRRSGISIPLNVVGNEENTADSGVLLEFVGEKDEKDEKSERDDDKDEKNDKDDKNKDPFSTPFD